MGGSDDAEAGVAGRGSRGALLAAWTVGHSNQSAAALLDLLARYRVALLVDTRSQPASRFSPHFGRRALERALHEASLHYLFLGDRLGGRPADRSCYDAEGRVDYDRIEARAAYQEGIEQLLVEIGRQRVCLLCSEEDPLRCHRRLLVGRTLRRRGVEVQHLRRDGRIETEDEVDRRSPRGLR